MKFNVHVQYFKPDSGKWYTDYEEEIDEDNIQFASNVIEHWLRHEAHWPGLTTRDHFIAVVTITGTQSSRTFLWDPEKRR